MHAQWGGRFGHAVRMSKYLDLLAYTYTNTERE
jgi:hypothetical protein